jgi:hypothetical protein
VPCDYSSCYEITRKCSEVTLLDQVLVASNGKSMLYTGCTKECKKMRLGLMHRCISNFSSPKIIYFSNQSCFQYSYIFQTNPANSPCFLVKFESKRMIAFLIRPVLLYINVYYNVRQLDIYSSNRQRTSTGRSFLFCTDIVSD